MKHAWAAVAVLSVLLALAPSAGASDTALRGTLDSWSQKLGADAHSVALAAQRHHPRRMTYSALRFRADAQRAGVAITAVKPSTPRGNQARKLALAAFADYVKAGSLWAATGRARLKGQQAAARNAARKAAADAVAGNKLLVSAGKLLR